MCTPTPAGGERYWVWDTAPAGARRRLQGDYTVPDCCATVGSCTNNEFCPPECCADDTAAGCAGTD